MLVPQDSVNVPHFPRIGRPSFALWVRGWNIKEYNRLGHQWLVLELALPLRDALYLSAADLMLALKRRDPEPYTMGASFGSGECAILTRLESKSKRG